MKQKGLIGEVKFHSTQKFELLAEYAKGWAAIMEASKKCDEIVFVDCMSNSGVYLDSNGVLVYGTPIRVAEILSKFAVDHPNMKVTLVFNDYDGLKIEMLSILLPKNTKNFHCELYVGDAHKLLSERKENFQGPRKHFLLIYDPFEAEINWHVLAPYVSGWGDVIINHMVSDTVRAGKVVKKPEKKQKYLNTYPIQGVNILDSMLNGSVTKDDLEHIVECVLRLLRQYKNNETYLGVAPFIGPTRSLIYNLIMCSGSIRAFTLFKKVSWETFGWNVCVYDKQQDGSGVCEEINLFDSIDVMAEAPVNKNNYTIDNIVDYIQKEFNGQQQVLWEDVKNSLAKHPIYPCAFLNEIKDLLVRKHGAKFFKWKSVSFVKKELLQ